MFILRFFMSREHKAPQKEMWSKNRSMVKKNRDDDDIEKKTEVQM